MEAVTPEKNFHRDDNFRGMFVRVANDDASEGLGFMRDSQLANCNKT
jgi:hypothetical protein